MINLEFQFVQEGEGFSVNTIQDNIGLDEQELLDMLIQKGGLHINIIDDNVTKTLEFTVQKTNEVYSVEVVES